MSSDATSEWVEAGAGGRGESDSTDRRVRRQRSIYRVHYALQPRREEMAVPWPHGGAGGEGGGGELLTAYDSQVAGHTGGEHNKYLGLLQCNNGTVLKPLLKESQRREMEFYQRVNAAKHPDLVELASFVPKYFGCRKFTYNGHETEYIILEDLAARMLEPCIMDVKIGRRTWDPLASEDKIRRERDKYSECKREYAFCIPGYQVYRVPTGHLHKYGKEHGKRLHGQMVKDAIRNYLNGAGRRLCRALILQFLSQLWKVQRWSARQTSVRLYSTSLLLVYDATALRNCCGEHDPLSPHPAKCVPAAAARSVSTGGEGGSVVPAPPTPPSPAGNYESTLSRIRLNYRAVLGELTHDDVTTHRPPPTTVRVIDFAHAFFDDAGEERGAGEGKLDDNFREGVDNFVLLFEDLLKETDDQLF